SRGKCAFSSATRWTRTTSVRTARGCPPALLPPRAWARATSVSTCSAAMTAAGPAVFIAFVVLFHPTLSGCSGGSVANAFSSPGGAGGGGSAGYVASQPGAGTDGRGATSGGGTENGG